MEEPTPDFYSTKRRKSGDIEIRVNDAYDGAVIQLSGGKWQAVRRGKGGGELRPTAGKAVLDLWGHDVAALVQKEAAKPMAQKEAAKPMAPMPVPPPPDVWHDWEPDEERPA
jgi:hypothetical protein